MTLLDYFNTPETSLPQELIYGQVFLADAPFVSHQRVLFKLAMSLAAHINQSGTGELFIAPIDVVLDADRALVVQPDMLFVSQDRLVMVHERIYGPPDLVIEILSPHPRIGHINERIARYAGYGVPEIWVYHQPERRMDILVCAGGDVVSQRSFGLRDHLVSSVLPAFQTTLGAMIDL